MPPAAVAAALAERFPALFAAGRALPIKLRIQADLQQRAPGVFNKKSLSLFLHRYTTSTAYLKALVGSPQRIDLDGAPAGDIADEHRQAAQVEIERRRALVDARRSAERQAQRNAVAPEGGAADTAAPLRPPRPAQTRQDPPGPRRDPRQDGPRRDPRSDGLRRDARPDSRPSRPTRPGQQPDSWPASSNAQTVHQPVAGHHQTADEAPAHPAPAAPDPARQERAQLLRAYEASTLTRANFCVLKRINEADLVAALALAQQERDQARREGGSAPARPASAPTRPNAHPRGR